MIRIVLAEGHAVIREGFKSLLEAEPDMEIVAEPEDGLGVLPAVERHPSAVLVVDAYLGGLNGLDVTRLATRKHEDVRIVVVSVDGDTGAAARAFRAGAHGYVWRMAPAGELPTAIREVAGGRRYVGPPLSLEEVVADAARVPEPRDEYEGLSLREREVLQLSAEGLSNPRISRRLGISARTVETHRANAMKKLGLRRHAEIVHYAIRSGLVAPIE